MHKKKRKINPGLSDMSSPTHLTTGITSSLLYHFLASCLSKLHVPFSGPLSARNIASNEIAGVTPKQFQVVKEICKVQLGKSFKVSKRTAELMQVQCILHKLLC